MINRERLLNTFLKYVKIDTQSTYDSKNMPSTDGQIKMAEVVKRDFELAGLKEIELTKEGFLFGTIPSNLGQKVKVPTIGLLAHFDTAVECSGRDVKPQVLENYNGKDITLPEGKDVILRPTEVKGLSECKGHTIITADGTTLLGGDDKTGVAELVELAYYFKEHPEKKHGKLRLVIIPDEEIAVGAEKLDLNKFGVDVAYTVDGTGMGEIDVESFNGFRGTVEVEGVVAFPGYGKGIYLSATRVLSEFVASMNSELWPENCEERDDIWWVDSFKGEVDKSSMVVFLRSFDLDGINNQKKMLEGIKEKLLKKYPKAKINIDIKESYKNYKYELDKDPRVVKLAEEAIKRVGLDIKHQYVRGGNDSCHLCFNGLLSTNLSAGYHNMHSLKEWASLHEMEKSVETLIHLSDVWMERGV